LDVLAELGSKLQLKMNALNAEVNALKRHVSTADAQAEDDDDDRRSVRDQLECNDDDNVYYANAGLTDQVHGANDNITGCELCPS
jgi:hypothetical protein